VDVLVDGESYFTRFIDAVDAAEKSVQLQAYIFDNDDYAVTIGELLKRRSNEGIEVKVLLDGLGTISGTMADSPSLPEQHVPPPSVRQFLESDSQIDVRQKSNPWFTGDHVKATVIDHRVAFVGGMNIGREYRYDWHDLMMQVRGPIVDIIDREFHVSWGHAGPLGDLGYIVAQASPPKHSAEDGGYPMRVLLTEPGNYEIYNAQLSAIRRAQSYIYIQNAYFTDDSLLRELVMARRRGVDVRVIIPLESDHGAIGRSNVLAANLMLKHGIRVYFYPGFSHVKAAIYDGWTCVGSANFDRWSLRLNRELNLASSDPVFTGQFLERVFEPDFRLAPELTEPVPDRWIDHLVEIFADYIY
jgi:cardiolipin synthase